MFFILSRSVYCFIYFNNRIFFVQNRINYFGCRGNFYLVKKLQNVLVSSIAAKLKSVENSLENFNGFFLSLKDEEKLKLAINLNAFFFLNLNANFILLKSKGFSKYFKFPFLYNVCTVQLISLSLSPLDNLFSQKSYSNFRPFRSSEDFFSEIKTLLFKRNGDSPFKLLNFKFYINTNLEKNNLILNKFPLEKRILKSCLSYLQFRGTENLNAFSNITFYFISFLLSGLL